MWLARLVICLAALAGVGGWCLAESRAEESSDSTVERVSSELKHAVETDPDHQPQDADPLSVDPDLALWTLVVFVILLIVLRKFAWGPIMQSLEGRENSIADHIAQAERNHEEAKRLLAQYEQKLAQAATQVRDLLEEARRDGEQVKQGILAEAKAAAESERVRALRDIDAAADQAMEKLAKQGADLAVELAGKILQTKLTPADHARLIDEAVAKFPASNPSAN